MAIIKQAGLTVDSNIRLTLNKVARRGVLHPDVPSVLTLPGAQVKNTCASFKSFK